MKHIRTTFFWGSLIGLLFGCSESPPASGSADKPEEENPAQRIIDQAIAAHGLEGVVSSELQFTFRDRDYLAVRQDGTYTYERRFLDTTGAAFKDVLTNKDFIRTINGDTATLTEERKTAYSSSVNSVIYFALLPWFLNDPAVQKEYLGTSRLKGEPYDKIKVTFWQEDGGKDHEDEFVYWFHSKQHTMDYLAYNYLTDGGGARFRQAYNIRSINGTRFADYINYKPTDPEERRVERFDALFESGAMEELSRIDLRNIEYKLLDKR